MTGVQTCALPIYILKPQAESAWAWDPFDRIGHPTWKKNLTLVILLLLFPFTCIEMPLTCTGHIIVRLGKFDLLSVFHLWPPLCSHKQYFGMPTLGTFFVGGGAVDGIGKDVRPRLTPSLCGGPRG